MNARRSRPSQTAARGRQTPDRGRRSVGASRGDKGESTMRGIFFAALVGLGIGLVGASPSLAGPANGSALANAANLNQAVDQVYWRRYYHRHWWWRHHWHHRWW